MGLCCRQPGMDPRTPILRSIPPLTQTDMSPAGCNVPEHRVRLDLCQTVCCHTPGGSRFLTLWGSCEARGGWKGECPAGDYVCCRSGDVYDLVPADACRAPGEPRKGLECDRICCRMVDETMTTIFAWSPAGRCAQVGTWVELRECTTDGSIGN